MNRVKVLNPTYFLRLLFVLALTGSVALQLNLAQETSQAETHEGFLLKRDANVPDLPFEDNPDPTLCGIPEPWGEDDPAWLSGYFEGDLIQEEVLLYDSHLRRSIVGSAPNGTEIEIILFQVNPSLNYYLVRTVGLAENVEGWLPAPFVDLERPSQPLDSD